MNINMKKIDKYCHVAWPSGVTVKLQIVFHVKLIRESGRNLKT